MSVLIIKNCAREGPGILGEILSINEIEQHIIELENNTDIPSPLDHEAFIVLGGPASANDTTFAIRQEIIKIKDAVMADVPYLGICLGMQALVKACGGNIISNPIKEIGWKDFEGRSFLLELTQAGINDPVFKGLAATLPIFHLHQETAKLTDNMRLLATGKHCKNQVVKVGKTAYGFQGHAELTESMLDNWLKEDDNLRQLTSEEVKRDYFAVREEYENNAKKIFTNFLRIADLL